MGQENWAGLACATAVWLVLGTAVVAGYSSGPMDSRWVVTSSGKIASHPTLVRIAEPKQMAMAR